MFLVDLAYTCIDSNMFNERSQENKKELTYMYACLGLNSGSMTGIDYSV